MRHTSDDRRRAGRTKLSAGVLLLSLALGAGAAAQGSSDAAGASDSAEAAVAVVRSLHAALVSAAGDAAAVTPEQRYRLLEPTILATHDLPYIAELTIRRQWRNLDAADRHRFVAAFTRLSVMTYATRFAEVRPDAFEIRGTEPAGDGRLEVRAAIVRPGEEDISLDYVLHERDGEWRIVNILADGVSDLALKRAQYQRIFSDGGTIDDVIALIEAETNRL